jgi:hypothetical protein
MSKQHRLTIADAHLQVILRGLAKEPWQVANPIITSISHQLQMAEKADAATREAGPDRPTIDEKGGIEIPNGHDKKAPLI